MQLTRHIHYTSTRREHTCTHLSHTHTSADMPHTPVGLHTHQNTGVYMQIPITYTCRTPVTHTHHGRHAAYTCGAAHTPEHRSLRADSHNIHVPHAHTFMHVLHSAQATYSPESTHTKHTTRPTDTTNTFVHMLVPHTPLKASSFHRKLRPHAHQLKEGQSSANRNTRLEHSHPLL